MGSTVRVEDDVHAALLEISKAERRPIGQVIEDAILQYRRAKFWQGVHEDYSRLRASTADWKDYQDEVQMLGGGSLDGLMNEAPYYSQEEEELIRADAANSQVR